MLYNCLQDENLYLGAFCRRRLEFPCDFSGTFIVHRLVDERWQIEGGPVDFAALSLDLIFSSLWSVYNLFRVPHDVYSGIFIRSNLCYS